MSPQPRRGKPAPTSHHKTPTHGSADAGRSNAPRPSDTKPADSAATPPAAVPPKPSPVVPAAPAKPAVAVAPTKGAAAAPVKASVPTAKGHEGSMGVARKNRPAGVSRKSPWRTVATYVQAYVPLLLAFLVVFAGLWAWVSFGPHTPSAQERWTAIDTKWVAKTDADLTAVGNETTNFKAQLDAYKTLRDDTKSWMDALAAVTDWGSPTASAGTNTETNTAVQTLIQVGNDEVTVMDQVLLTKTANDVLAMRDQITGAQQTFATDYELARLSLFPITANSPGPSLPTIALPSGSLSPTASPTATPSPVPSVTPAPTPSPTANGSPVASPSASPS